jgi:hypothetical protein
MLPYREKPANRPGGEPGRPGLEEGRTMNTRASILLAAVSASALVLAGCGGDQQGQAQQPAGDRAETGADERTGATDGETVERSASTEDTEAATTRMEDTGARGGDNAAEGNGRATEEGSGEDGGRGERVSLEIRGSPGTAFSGVCSVGDEEAELAGEVPQRFVYYPEGRKIHCELRKEDAGSGNLKVVLAGPGNRIVQQTNAESGTVELTLSGKGGGSSSSSVSTSTNSSSSSSSSVSSSSVNSSSSSSSNSR